MTFHFSQKIACFARLLDGGYPHSYIEAAVAAFALIMSKLRTPCLAISANIEYSITR